MARRRKDDPDLTPRTPIHEIPVGTILVSSVSWNRSYIRYFKVISSTPQQVELVRLQDEDRITRDGKRYRVPLDTPVDNGRWTFRKKVHFNTPYEPGVYAGNGKAVVFVPDEGCDGKYLYRY
jgi:hypothetical protein